jgi:hypothetical protein
VATTIRTPKNIYILNEIEEEKKFLGREYESFLLHRRIGHIHLDNVFKINKKQVVREIP